MEDRSQLADRILDQVADAVIYANRSGEIIRWNRASAVLFGYSAEEALGQSLDLIIPPHTGAASKLR
jgi:PAS domain S-box-containing protein